MSETQGGASPGLFSAARDIAVTLLAGARTRLELLSNEIEVEKLCAIELLFAILAITFCIGVGVILTIVLLAVSFWEQRLAVLGVCALVFLALGVGLLVRFRQRLHRPERIFTASIAELEQDLRQLKAATGHESPDR
jgi:uncharacterized membrane protein YqjE